MMQTLLARAFVFAALLGVASQAKSATLLFALTENGLLYRSADGAKTWQNIVLPARPGQFEALAVDPENSSNLYVDVSVRGKAAPGQQDNYFFRSTDGGATWAQSKLSGPPQLVVVDPTSSNIVYAGIGGFFRSTDSGVTFSATSITAFVEGIGTDALHPGVVYVPTHDGKVYKSTDFGATWTQLAGILPPQFNRLLSVAADPNNSSVLWGTGEGSCLDSNRNAFICGLVQSSDGGNTWQAVGSVKGWFKNVVVDARNGNIYAGGQDDTQPVAKQALAVKSTDGGATWSQITTGLSKYSVEVHLDPENAAALYTEQANLIADLGPGGGVYASTDGGASWTFNAVDASQGQFDVVYGLAAVSESNAVPTPPVISSNGVVNGASFQPGIVPNSWVTIQGTHLASKTDDWSNSIVNSEFPTTLDGVSVEIGGKSAYVYFISPGQINVISPDVGLGSQDVTVTTAAGTSAKLSVSAAQYGPAFFLWPNNQPVATRQDFSYAAKNGTFAGTATVAAKPSDVIILWGTGFGPTNPVAAPGAPVPSDTTYSTTAVPQVTINGVSATVYGAALAPGFAGLYQVAIQVPDSITNGDWPIQVSVGGVESPAGVVLTVQD
jgi:uncharacterized protein (TIGR03437 family)